MSARRRTLRSADDLVAAGLVGRDAAAGVERVAARYAVAVTPAIQRLIDRADPADPIARQFLPDLRELHHTPQELADPIGDAAKSPVKGLVHRYPDRVLLKVVGVCPVYCRFCFRREMVGPDAGHTMTRAEIETALDYVRAHPGIFEVILTGGDPFMLSAERASALTLDIAAIPHVKVLRWHTRVPVAAPELITDDLLAALRAGLPKAVFVAVHVNHPRELGAAAVAALARLADASVGLVSQSVLLKGVNDDVETLESLMRALLAARVKPYYLHHADLAPGTGHFRTTLAEGQSLMRELRMRLSGLAMPTYVVDIPGAYGKVPAGPGYVHGRGAPGAFEIEDPRGGRHSYGPSSPDDP
jgi:lysine 2,3-aminomutase